jgi:signal transduction histidine kinase
MSKNRNPSALYTRRILPSLPEKLEIILKLILNMVLDMVKCNSGHIRLLEGDRLVLKASKGKFTQWIPRERKLGAGHLASQVVKSGKHKVIPDVMADPNFKKVCNVNRRTEYGRYLGTIKSEVVIPLKTEKGTCGVFYVHKPVVSGFSKSDVEFLRGLSSIAAIAIENTQLHEAEKAALHDIDNAFLGEFDDQKVFDLVVEHGLTIVGCKSCHLRVLDEENKQLVLKARSGPHTHSIPKNKTLQEGYLAAKVVKSKKYKVIKNVAKDPNFKRVLRESKGSYRKYLETIGSEVVIPLQIGNEVLGVFYAHKPEIDAFSDDDVQLLLDLARRISTAISYTKLIKEMRLQHAQRLELERVFGLGLLASAVEHSVRNALNSISVSQMEAKNILINILSEPNTKKTQKVIEMIDADLSRIEQEAEYMEKFREFVQGLSERAKKSIVDINSEIEETLVFVNHEFRSRGIKLNLILDKNIPKVLCASVDLKLICLNIIENAISALKEQVSKPQIHIETSFRNDLNTVEIRFTNNGPPIPKENIQRIFDPFFTTKDRGTGLGLAITKQNVRRNGGVIDVESNNTATTFIVRLPSCSKG